MYRTSSLLQSAELDRRRFTSKRFKKMAFFLNKRTTASHFVSQSQLLAKDSVLKPFKSYKKSVRQLKRIGDVLTVVVVVVPVYVFVKQSGISSLVDIAYIPFVGRFHIVFAEAFKHDVTEGRSKLATWLKEVNKIDAYTQTKVDPQEIVDRFKKRCLSQYYKTELAFVPVLHYGIGFCPYNITRNWVLSLYYNTKLAFIPVLKRKIGIRPYTITQNWLLSRLRLNLRTVNLQVKANFRKAAQQEAIYLLFLFNFSDRELLLLGGEESTARRRNLQRKAGMTSAAESITESLVVHEVERNTGTLMTLGRELLLGGGEESTARRHNLQTKAGMTSAAESITESLYPTRQLMVQLPELSGAQVVRSPPLTSTSDRPPHFNGTTRLYINYDCPYAQRVWIARNYKGLQNKINMIPINLQDRPAWYKEKVYPENKVPSLEHNGKVLGESLDLIKYVDANIEGTPLFPSDPAKKEFGEQLISHADTFTKEPFISLKGQASSAFEYLENALGKFDDGPFLLGQFSLCSLNYECRIGFCPCTITRNWLLSQYYNIELAFYYNTELAFVPVLYYGIGFRPSNILWNWLSSHLRLNLRNANLQVKANLRKAAQQEAIYLLFLFNFSDRELLLRGGEESTARRHNLQIKAGMTSAAESITESLVVHVTVDGSDESTGVLKKAESEYKGHRSLLMRTRNLLSIMQRQDVMDRVILGIGFLWFSLAVLYVVSKRIGLLQRKFTEAIKAGVVGHAEPRPQAVADVNLHQVRVDRVPNIEAPLGQRIHDELRFISKQYSYVVSVYFLILFLYPHNVAQR
ncbi:hypothetical protein VNO80_29265 [Phaseolus coccineus]|uniref:GST N-terminal domain-containing protein n=1 Tax=Phaseolus coccineus TaxID=3886 RepID=A0AAN9LDG2_PHACN